MFKGVNVLRQFFPLLNHKQCKIKRGGTTLKKIGAGCAKSITWKVLICVALDI